MQSASKIQTQTMTKMDVKAMWSTADRDDQFGYKHASCITIDLKMQCENVTWEGSQMLRELEQLREEKQELHLFPLG